MQSVMTSKQEEWDHEKHQRNVFDEMYNDWAFVPKENLGKIPISNALRWDFEIMEDPINHPIHDHCHHLSQYAQKKWAKEVAIPQIKLILQL